MAPQEIEKARFAEGNGAPGGAGNDPLAVKGDPRSRPRSEKKDARKWRCNALKNLDSRKEMAPRAASPPSSTNVGRCIPAAAEE